MRAAALLLALVASSALAGDDLTPLTDEFDDASTLAQWQRVYLVEQWNANQLELQDINNTRPGHMVMMPFTSTWFDDYRGELTFKQVQGDFVVTSQVDVSQRGGAGAPRSNYSLGGLMIRNPRQVTPATWHPGGENYVFLSLGAASIPGTLQFEVKTTTNSNSVLFITDGVSSAIIQIARIGPYVITLHSVGGVWSVHRRFYRPDFAQIMQVGMTTYTDFATCSMYQPFVHNSMVIHAGNPDLVAAYDYVRFERPNVPANLTNANFMDTVAVTDSMLLSFLGANATANAPSIDGQPSDVGVTRGGTASFHVSASGAALRYQWRKNGIDLPNATSSTLAMTNVQPSDAATYSVVVTNAAGTATSREARLTVVPQTPPRRRAVRG
jgi:hypothetical protein